MTEHVAHIAIVVAGDIAVEGRAGGNIQLIGGRSVHKSPVGGEAGGSDQRGRSRYRCGHGGLGDDVGVRTGSTAVEGPQPVIVGRAGFQPGYGIAGHIEHVQTVVGRQNRGKVGIEGHIQQIGRGTCGGGPGSLEAGLGDGGGGRGNRCRWYGSLGDGGHRIGAGSAIVIGPDAIVVGHTR